jgi:predicted RNA-binding Zn ribbon-like protein
MAGEIQPGGRAPAPGELRVVQAFINSHYDLEREHGAELLSTPTALARWLRRHGLLQVGCRPAPADLATMVELRETLRRLADPRANVTAEVLNRFAAGAPLELHFDGSAPNFVRAARGGVPAAIGALLGITARAMLDGTWGRLKVCPGEDCGWAFYDHSRNQTGRWCSMAVCGGRAKARSHYRRRREAG